jgi:DNA polymerase sigma
VREVIQLEKPVDLQGDFLSFGDCKDFSVQVVQKVSENKEEGGSQRSREYPWMSKQTSKIRDIFLFLHAEILDFVKYIQPSEQDKLQRKGVVDRI